VVDSGLVSSIDRCIIGTGHREETRNAKQKPTMKKHITIISYIVLFIGAYVYMLAARMDHDAFAGMFLVILSLPWSLAAIPIAVIISHFSPEFMNTHSDSVGMPVIFIGGLINLYVIHRMLSRLSSSKTLQK
jgi:hypothetical protein